MFQVSLCVCFKYLCVYVSSIFVCMFQVSLCVCFKYLCVYVSSIFVCMFQVSLCVCTEPNSLTHTHIKKKSQGLHTTKKYIQQIIEFIYICIYETHRL